MSNEVRQVRPGLYVANASGSIFAVPPAETSTERFAPNQVELVYPAFPPSREVAEGDVQKRSERSSLPGLWTVLKDMCWSASSVVVGLYVLVLAGVAFVVVVCPLILLYFLGMLVSEPHLIRDWWRRRA